MEGLTQQLGKVSEIDQLKEDLKRVQTQFFTSSEEHELKSEYGLTDRDIKKLAAFKEDAGLPSLKAGLFYVPEIKEKILHREEKQVAKKAIIETNCSLSLMRLKTSAGNQLISPLLLTELSWS